MAQSPHRRWEGCPVCAPHKNKENGRPVRDPWREVRKTGLKRRYGRHWAPEEERSGTPSQKMRRGASRSVIPSGPACA